MKLFNIENFSLLLGVINLILVIAGLWDAKVSFWKKLLGIFMSLVIVVSFILIIVTGKKALPNIELMTTDNIRNINSQYWDSSWAGAWGQDQIFIIDGKAFDDQSPIISPQTEAYWFSYSNSGIRFPSRLPSSNDSSIAGSNSSSIILRWQEYSPSTPGETWTAAVFGFGNGKPIIECSPSIYNTFDLSEYDFLQFDVRGNFEGDLLVRLEDDYSVDGVPGPNSTQPLKIVQYLVDATSISRNKWTKVMIPLDEFEFSQTAFPQNRDIVNIKKIKQVSFSSTEGRGDVLISAIIFTGKLD